MSFATLMVHVDVEPKSDARIRLAAQLADRFASTLIGISACILPPYPAEGAYFVTREFIEQEQQDILGALQRTEASFRAAAGEKGAKLQWLEWRSADRCLFTMADQIDYTAPHVQPRAKKGQLLMQFESNPHIPHS